MICRNITEEVRVNGIHLFIFSNYLSRQHRIHLTSLTGISYTHCFYPYSDCIPSSSNCAQASLSSINMARAKSSFGSPPSCNRGNKDMPFNMGLLHTVACQRGGVSKEPPWLRAVTRHGPVTL